MHHCKDEEKLMAMGVYIPDEVLLIFGSNYFNASLWLRGISYVQYVDRRVLKGDGKMKVVNIHILYFLLVCTIEFMNTIPLSLSKIYHLYRY